MTKENQVRLILLCFAIKNSGERTYFPLERLIIAHFSYICAVLGASHSKIDGIK